MSSILVAALTAVAAGALVLSACGDDSGRCVVKPEVCDGADNDCDGAVDEELACIACEAGAAECVDGRARVCSNGMWSAFEACPGGFCADARSCGACENGCPVIGQLSCVDGMLRTCAADAHGCRAWGAETACPDGFCVNATACGVCAGDCQPGAADCEAGKLRTCGARAQAGCGTWGAQTSCPDGVCASRTACGECNHACPAVGASECTGGAIRSCQTDPAGCRAWGPLSECPSGFCANAEICGDCEPGCPASGQTECSGGQRRTCAPDTGGCLAWTGWSACADGFCTSTTACGTCNDQCAAIGETRCADGQSRTCEADANGCLVLSAGTACPAGFCASAASCGACNHGCPSVGAAECTGGQLRTCQADANGCRQWSAATACPEGQCASATACGGRVNVVISEFRYDTTSTPDTDSFVELFGPAGTSLAGLTLVGVNGNGGGDYNAIALNGTIPASGFFLIAHPSGTLTAIANQLDSKVDYQNGPDSIQLRQGTTVLDAVGYGSFASGTIFAGEGRPTPETAVNGSLTRDAAGTDTDDNFADFSVVSIPTPGRAPGTCDGACADAGMPDSGAAGQPDAGGGADGGVADGGVSEDPFDPASCSGASLTDGDASALLGTQARVVLGDFTLVHRTRTCDTSGCSAWSAPATYEKTLAVYSGGVVTRYKSFVFPTKLVLWGSAGARKLTVRESNDYAREATADSSGVVFSLGDVGPKSYPGIRLYDPAPSNPYDYQDFPVILGDEGYLYTGAGCARFLARSRNGTPDFTEEVVGLYRF